jgi:hypothetical protein
VLYDRLWGEQLSRRKKREYRDCGLGDRNCQSAVPP